MKKVVKKQVKKVAPKGTMKLKKGFKKHESSANTKFFDFSLNDYFEGEFVEKKTSTKIDKFTKKPKVNLVFKDLHGNLVVLPNHFQIQEAIESHGVCDYQIKYLGSKKLTGKQTIHEYEIATND